MVRNEEPMAQALPASEPASVKWTDLVALPVRLISPLGGALGRDVAWFVRWASAALAIVGAFAFCVIGPSAIRSADSKRRRFAAVILSGVFCGILTVIACSWLWGRLPVQYFIISGWVWPFLLGGLFEIPWVAKRWRAILGVMLLLTGALGVSHVLGDPREDFKQGVAVASRLAMEGDTLCTAVLAQPAHYDNLTPFDVYATTVRPKSNDWVKRNPHRPCVVLTRSLRGSEADRLEVLSFHLGKNRRILRRITVDRHIDVYLLSPAVH
jgi:hypothetical protein